MVSLLTAEGLGSIPGQGTKIPQAMRCGQKNFKNKSSQEAQGEGFVLPLKPALSPPSAISPRPEAAFGLQLACFPSVSPRDFSLIQQILSTCPGPAGDTAVTSPSPTQGSQWQGQAHSERAAPDVDKTGIGRVVHGVAEGFQRGRVTELGAEVLGDVKRGPGGGDSTVSSLAGGI